MKYLVCFLEEESAREMLEGVLSRLLPKHIAYKCYHFEGKRDLEKQLAGKLRNWQMPNSKFLIIMDQDRADCRAVKKRLSELCEKAGKPEALIRIACHELESFYFGDLVAVEAGLGISNIAHYREKAKYRVPDDIPDPADELEKLTNGKYQKVDGSRRIGRALSLEPNTNTSDSFTALLSGIRKLLSIA